MVTLGNELRVSPMGFGCMGITAFYGPSMEDEDAVALLTAAHRAGYAHFDTSEVYAVNGGKHNETQLGNFLKTVPRECVTVATKFYPAVYDHKCDLETVRGAVDASLSRLGLDYVDLYYCHRAPSTLDAAVEWMQSMKVLVESGKVRHVGLSEFGTEWIRELHAIHPVACVQQEWSLLTRNLEDTLVPVLKELGIGVVAYSPLARNLLAAPTERPADGDWRLRTVPRYSEENFAKNQELVARIAAVAEARGTTVSQLSLAWLYQRAKDVDIPMVAIPGTTKVANATSNIASLDLSLTEQEMDDLAELGKLVAGERGNEGYKAKALERWL